MRLPSSNSSAVGTRLVVVHPVAGCTCPALSSCGSHTPTSLHTATSKAEGGGQAAARTETGDSRWLAAGPVDALSQVTPPQPGAGQSQNEQLVGSRASLS